MRQPEIKFGFAIPEAGKSDIERIAERRASASIPTMQTCSLKLWWLAVRALHRLDTEVGRINNNADDFCFRRSASKVTSGS